MKQVRARRNSRTINTGLDQNTPFQPSFQPAEQSRRDRPTRPPHLSTQNSRGSFNTATRSQAVPAWLRPLNNIMSISYLN